MKMTFGKLLGAVVALMFAIIIGTKAAQAQDWDKANDLCTTWGNYSMAVSKMRDEGIRADVVFEYSVDSLDLDVDLMRKVIENIYINGRYLTPDEVGKAYYKSCMEHLTSTSS